MKQVAFTIACIFGIINVFLMGPILGIITVPILYYWLRLLDKIDNK